MPEQAFIMLPARTRKSGLYRVLPTPLGTHSLGALVFLLPQNAITSQ